MTKRFAFVRAAIAAAFAAGAAFAADAAFAMETGTLSIRTSPAKPAAALTGHQEFARSQLVATVKLYDEHLRVKSTGQYLDNIDTHKIEQDAVSSSVASTGIGLISLVIGDRIGSIDGAAEKAKLTLSNLLGEEPGSSFRTPRSKNGWYKHFIDAYTGEPRNVSKDVFSTIDTAILGVGASMAARYFQTKAGFDPKAAEAARLADALVESVDWGQAIKFGDAPGVHQLFHGFDEGIENRHWSLLFDEYVILPCLGRAMDARHGRVGPATQFWDKYVRDVSRLPQTNFENLSILSVSGRSFTSHFTHQFAFYFCNDLANDPAYIAELNELRLADRKWFERAGEGRFPERWWGLGAGSEIKFDPETGAIKYSGYGVAQIDRNPNLTFSPAIMAGFLPVEAIGKSGVRKAGGPLLPEGQSGIVADLIALYERNECRYNFAGLDFLWRCTARDPSLRVQHIEGVDLSTYMLGLAWFDPALGKAFFDDYAVKARPSFPEARELRAGLSTSFPPSGKK